MIKRSFVLAVVLLVLAIFVQPLYAAQSEKEAVNPVELNSVIVEQISSVINADKVLGQPVAVGERTIVPVVCMFFGFGSCESTMQVHTGTGGGGVGMVMPMSMLVISPEGDLSLVEAKKSQIAEVIKGLGLAFLDKIDSADIRGAD